MEYSAGVSSLRNRMQLPALSQPPRLWVTDPHGERRVTWMELFFDLIFVAAVAQVGAPLAKDYSWGSLLRYGFLFVLIWWAWSGHTLYSTRFDHDDLVHRVLIWVWLLWNDGPGGV